MAVDDATAENTQFAESRIRDTDMAEEMVTNSKHSILQQAGQSMLAQANQSTQGVLSLLQ
jgi:flagellin